MNREYLLDLNGEILDGTSPVLFSGNRAFRYGDSVFETIRVFRDIPVLFREHYLRLIKSAQFLNFALPGHFTEDFFREKIGNLLHSNLVSNGRLRLTFFRQAGGAYLPPEDTCAYLLEVNQLESDLFPLNPKGLKVDVFPDLTKPVYHLSNHKTGSSVLHVLAGVYTRDHGLDDCVLLNQENRVAEFHSSNLFLVKNGELYTPSLAEGALNGIMRKTVIRVARDLGLAVMEGLVTVDNLFEADELFLTNAIRGINWVEGFRTKTYACEIIRVIHENLVDNIFKLHQIHR